jgi:hypothetical protein
MVTMGFSTTSSFLRGAHERVALRHQLGTVRHKSVLRQQIHYLLPCVRLCKSSSRFFQQVLRSPR